MSLYHVKTQTVPDSTATTLVRPSDWNSAHAQALTISGNTAGQSTVSGTNIVFQGGSNVTLSALTAAGVATVVFSAAAGGGGGVAISAGTNSTSTGTVAFADANGVTFGMNTNGVVTASHNGLTTAAQSDHTHSQYINTSQSSLFQQTSNTSAITANAMNTSERGNYFYTSNNTFANSTHTHGAVAFSGTNVSGSFTSASNGLSLQLSAPAVGGAQTGISGISAGTTQMTSGTAVFANSNGVSFGVNGNTITASHNGLTSQSADTNKAGTGFTTTSTGGSVLVGTVGTNGVSLGVPAWVTAAAGGGDGYNIIGVNGGATQLSTTLQLSNSNNVTFGLNAGTITASASYSQSTQPVAYSAANGSANFSTLVFANSNGVSFSTGTQGVYATVATNYQSQGAYLTTARASNDAIGLNTALTANGVSVTANSSGLSLNFPAFLTTAALSNHSHGNPTLALTNITGTTASASNGLTLSLSGVAAQTTQTQPAGNIAGVGTTFGGTNVSGSMTLNSNGLVLSLSAPTPGGGAAINVSAGTTSGNLQTIQFNNANGVSFGLNGSTVTASVNAGGGGATESNYFPHKDALWVAGQVGQNSIQVQPMCNAPVVSYDRLAYGIQHTQATNSTMTVSCTVQMGIYTLNGSTLSQLTSGSGSFSINGQGTASSSANSGPRWATMTLNAGGTLSGDVWFAFRSSTATAGVNATLSNLLASRINSTWSGIIGVGTANTVQSLPGMGYYSATSAGLPTSMALSHITGVSSTAQRPQVFWLTNGALPI